MSLGCVLAPPSMLIRHPTPLDRQLQHINKKGRPVSQCPHCRGLRKSRASHVKCECGEKPHGKGDCTQPEKGDSKRERGERVGESVSDNHAADHHACCCSHGARCTCAIKKENHLDPVPELETPNDIPSPMSSGSPRKPALGAAQSDSHLTVFTNGHHKPAHRHNDAAHTCGLPYRIQRPHSIHGHSHLAHKSMDHIPSSRSHDPGHLRLRDSIKRAQQDIRLSRSLHGSPHGSPELRPLQNLDYLNSQLPPLDLNYSAWNFNTPPQEYQPRSNVDYSSYLSTPDDTMGFSAGAVSMPPVDWSALGLPMSNNSYQPYSQPPSYASFDQSNLGHPGLTTSSSGDVSEAGEDYTSSFHNSPSVPEAPSSAADPHRLSSASSLSQPSLFGTFHVEDLNIDNYLQHASASPPSFDEYSNGIVPTDTENLTRHGLNVRELQKMAHNGAMPSFQVDKAKASGGDFPLSHHSGSPLANEDPVWGASYEDDDPNFEIEAGRGEGAWAS